MNFQTVANQAIGKWHSILSTMGISDVYLSGKHCPCPICGGLDRFRFDNVKSRGDWICSSCGAGDGFSLLAKFKNISLKESKELVELLVKDAPKDIKKAVYKNPEDSLISAARFWSKTGSVVDSSPVGKYLINRIGQMFYTPNLRQRLIFHPSDKEKKYWVLAAKVTNPDGGGVTVHRTYVSDDGHKADLKPAKMLMPGVLPPGSAIRLFDSAEEMGIAEGIETALSASVLFGVNVWSSINATMMEKFNPPPVCKKLTIYADNDENFTGQAAAYSLANRLKMKTGIEVVVLTPDKTGDWNDELKRRQKI